MGDDEMSNPTFKGGAAGRGSPNNARESPAYPSTEEAPITMSSSIPNPVSMPSASSPTYTSTVPSTPPSVSYPSAHDSALSLATEEHDSAHSDDGQVFEDDGEQDDYDGDSAFGGSLIGCDTDTLASYITDYRYENGRRYHAYRDGEYWGPNDESSAEMQDLAHHMYLMTLEGKLHLAPLENPQNILDVGTGTGIWAIEMADAYPSAHVIGTDLSPTQPLFVPPNCAFEIEDLNLSWTYPPSTFDFIHIRELFGCVLSWDTFFSECYTACKPGGWVEILEHSVDPVSDDGTVHDGHFFREWGRTVIGLGEKFGKSFTIWEESKERLEKAGFEDVMEVRYKWPMNGWPSPEFRTHGDDGEKHWRRLRELGLWNQLRLYDGVEGFMIRLLTVVGGWSYEAAQVFLAQMRAAIKDTKTHAYLGVTVVYGRKPGGRKKKTHPSPSFSSQVSTSSSASTATVTPSPAPVPAPAAVPASGDQAAGS